MQKVIITISDLPDNKIDVRTEFKPEVIGSSLSPSVHLWSVLMERVKTIAEEEQQPSTK